jgi:hypothetical protein
MAQRKQPQSRKRRRTGIGPLSREHPTDEEQNALVDAMAHGSPVATAILGAAFVEFHLERAIRRRLPRNDDVTWKELITDKGPLGTLSMKIMMGHALRIYGDDLRDNLDIMRAVRNVFAHAKKLLQFNNEKIVKELRAVTGKPTRRYAQFKAVTVSLPPNEVRSAYLHLCMNLAMDLMMPDIRANEQKARRWKRKQSKESYYEQFIRAGRGTPRERLAAALIASGGFQTEVPEPGADEPLHSRRRPDRRRST